MNYSLIYYSYFLVFTFGFIINGRSVIIAFLQNELLLTNTQIGFLFTISGLVTIISNLAVGYIIETKGFKKLTLLSIFMSAIGILIYILPLTYFLLIIASVLIAIGINIKSFVANSLIVRVCFHNKSKFMNYNHLFYCFGSLIAPIFMTKFHKIIPYLNNYSISKCWRINFSFCYFFIFICLIGAIKLKFPGPEIKEHLNFNMIRSIILNKKVYFFMIILTTYVASEVSLSNWFILYLRSIDIPIKIASNYLSLFFIMMALGRFLGGKLLNDNNSDKFVISCFTILLILLILGFKTNYIFLSITGLFYSIVFPSILSKSYHDIKYKPNFSVGIIMAGLGAGFSISQGILGKLNDIYSIKTGLFIITLTSLIISFITFIIYLRTYQNNN